MSSSRLVSVILPFLNANQFIREAIESTIAQTYGNWELLLIDDGSTDGSTHIAQRYAHQWAGKVHYLEHIGHQNRGMSASRNLGIRTAKGEYITFLDADDLCLPNRLAEQVEILNSHPEAAMVCSRAQWWYGWTGKLEDEKRDFIQQLDVPLNTIVRPPTLLTLFLKDEWASLCDISVRKRVIEAVGGYEESFRGMYEDQAFHAKLCSQYSCYVSSSCLYRYRQHPDACTTVSHTTGRTHKAREVFLNWLEGYLFRLQIEDSQLERVLRMQLYPYRHPALFRMRENCRRKTRRTASLVRRIARLILFQPRTD
jgi:glycosyltransferase involved in cell wall biosynthesis